MNETMAIILVMISSIFAALGQLNLKIGSMKMNLKLSNIFRNYILLIGVSFYAIASIIGIIALRGGELTVLYPIASLNYVWVSLLSIKYLKEKMNLYKWTGILLIIIGVSIIL